MRARRGLVAVILLFLHFEIGDHLSIHQLTQGVLQLIGGHALVEAKLSQLLEGL